MKKTSHSRAVHFARSPCGPAPTGPAWSCGAGKSGFTLLELMTALAITSMLVVMLFAALNQASRAWTTAENRVETFTQARAALDYISKELSQAMASTNLPFFGDHQNLAFVAPVSDRASDGVDLVEVVYRLSQRSVNGAAPVAPNPFTDSAPPYRLVRRTAPFSASALYPDCWDYGQNKACNPVLPPWDFYYFGTTAGRDWPETGSPNRTAELAENVVALRFQFLDSQGHLYDYWNSTPNPFGAPWQNEIAGGIPYRVNLVTPSNPSPDDPLYMTNRAPAGVQITIGVVDSKTATRLSTLAVGSAPWIAITNQATRVFLTSIAIPNRQP